MKKNGKRFILICLTISLIAIMAMMIAFLEQQHYYMLEYEKFLLEHQLDLDAEQDQDSIQQFYNSLSEQQLFQLQQRRNITIIALMPIVVLVTVLIATNLVNRITPKKYIYISFTRSDTEIARTLISRLEKQFSSLSKYRFEIVVADSIPLGADMVKWVNDSISKAEIVLIIVSHAYLYSEWCIKEYGKIINAKKEGDKVIIPIVTTSFDDLQKLEEISGIKSLSLIGCDSEEAINKKMQELAIELIRRSKE